MRGCGAGGRYDRGSRHTRVEGLSAMEPLDDLDRPAKRTWPAEGVSRVPYRDGVKGAGGMSADFSLAEHGLERLAVAERHGVVFASFEGCMPALEDYLGQTNLGWFDRVFDGRQLKLLGNARQIVPANWKLMFENIKDPYHASLLHVFLVSFGLFRADQPSQVKMDATGRHAALMSQKGEQKAGEATAEMKSFKEDFKLHDPTLLQP